MSAASHYWHLQRLDSTGQCRRQRLDQAQLWLQGQPLYQQMNPATERDRGSSHADRSLQEHLLSLWRQAPESMVMACLCLRCLVSHAIRQACLQLVSQFGGYYQFRGADLFPYVLDDDGRPVSRYRSLGLHIIETFTPGKTSLESWAMHLTRNHPELNQFLIGQGLYRVSDWAILNDTAPSQLPKILGEFHTLTPTEVAAAQQLLSQYHQIYRRDRLQQPRRGGGRCAPPSPTQLAAINPDLATTGVLAQLRQLAYWLRQYRVHVRGGTPLAESLDAVEGADLAVAPTPGADTQQTDFLDQYRQQLQVALGEAITATVTAYCEKLRRKQPPKDQIFLQALHLFHCQGQSMGAIAPQIGLKTQIQVTRLMNLKRLRSDVRDALLMRLQERVPEAVQAVTSIERLTQIGESLQALLAEEADRVIAEAASEAQIPKNRTAASRFARQLCDRLPQLSTDLDSVPH